MGGGGGGGLVMSGEEVRCKLVRWRRRKREQ